MKRLVACTFRLGLIVFTLGTACGQDFPGKPIRIFTSEAGGGNEVVVNRSLPVTSIRELIVLAKARPGELNYAAVSIGSSSHLAAELFKAMAGVNVVSVVYKNNALAFADVMAGQV